ncbi:hexokinase-1 [Paracoccidioides lutzii Pb01]|uniref:Phosphotransferase n=1 Tax=Paracoccidioides lutzii (strain ATCC MYA-826 / Pb01) TaxID=502779 RepID=C1GS82_PARBA|nr:hexokinase-1 [Paracoccidioides lutzii Pb01]EEH38915.1 hexokinase-1 [Paracoccidioides lutzii Pb01]
MADAVATAARRMRSFFRSIMALLKRLMMFPSGLGDASDSKRGSISSIKRRRRSLDELSKEIERLFNGHLDVANLLAMSRKIRAQIDACAKSSPVSMLPSFNHTLPTGNETGTYLAMDLGGSTFRVALVELSGGGKMRIIRVKVSAIDEPVKLLEGKAFFRWMAERIEEMLGGGDEKYGLDSAPLPIGLSWSFPIEQTSIRSGRVISMGKGFLCSDGTVGDDLSELIMDACRERNLNVRIDAIVNDSSSTLLSRAYTDSSTRVSLILGTGTNAAIHFPVNAIGTAKFGNRPAEWFDAADHVIVNTELSMFGGGGVLPTTTWDDYLNRTHLKPDYQPLEYMCTGRYLGEIVRLVILDAVKTAGLFGGVLPESMRNPYSFDTAIAAYIQDDTSPSLTASSLFLQKRHTFIIPPSPPDLLFLQQICGYVTRRAAAYLATAIHALWCLRNNTEAPIILPTPDSTSTTNERAVASGNNPPKNDTADNSELNVTIACDGAVINKYPGFHKQCQHYLNELTLERDSSLPSPSLSLSQSATASSPSEQLITSVVTSPTITLELADESAIYGAAVAVAVAVPGN